jgi:hypothetical protein
MLAKTKQLLFIRNILESGIIVWMLAVQSIHGWESAPPLWQAKPSIQTPMFSGLEMEGRFEPNWKEQVLVRRSYSERDKRNHLLFATGTAVTIAGLVFIGSLYEGDVCGECSAPRRDGLASLAMGVSITGAALAIYALTRSE